MSSPLVVLDADVLGRQRTGDETYVRSLLQELAEAAPTDLRLAAITRRRFDAFLLDWLLSDGNASRVVEAIRSHRPHVPVIVVTGALADMEMEKTLLELSAQWNFSTVDKPVRPMNLANALKQMVAVARD